MAYLKSVVLDDVLGMNEQFERDMDYAVATYQCEWKSVVDDEDLRGQYRHFVNASDTDDTLAFVTNGRGQQQPANW
jgi:hypothetical protein